MYENYSKVQLYEKNEKLYLCFVERKWEKVMQKEEKKWKGKEYMLVFQWEKKPCSYKSEMF